MFDMFKMLGKLGEAQNKMAEIKDRLKNMKLEESELDGVVVVEFTADKNITKIRTSPEFYEKYSVEEREDILTEAINNAIQKAETISKEEIQKGMAGVIPNIPGLDMGNLPFGF